MKTHKKPRVRWCWSCGRKLWGNHHVEKMIDGHPRILHETCGKLYFSKHETIKQEEETHE